MITRTDYCSWDGNPAVLASYESGKMAAFEFQNGQWKAVHPADVFTKAADIGAEAFKALWPNLRLPDLGR